MERKRQRIIAPSRHKVVGVKVDDVSKISLVLSEKFSYRLNIQLRMKAERVKN